MASSLATVEPQASGNAILQPIIPEPTVLSNE